MGWWHMPIIPHSGGWGRGLWVQDQHLLHSVPSLRTKAETQKLTNRNHVFFAYLKMLWEGVAGFQHERGSLFPWILRYSNEEVHKKERYSVHKMVWKCNA
jgi:hypothetical protein